MPDEDPALRIPPEATKQPPAVPDERPYESARAYVDEIERSYSALMTEIDLYRGWLEEVVAAEQAGPDPDDRKLQALRPQLRYLAELQQSLEGATHEGLVRVADRVVRIRHWQDAVFI
jgi:hypothetical protein